MALACEDANSKLVDFVTVAHVDAEDHVGNSLLQILKLRFGHEVKFCSDFEHRVGQDFEVEVQATFWSWSLFSIWRWCFVEVMKLNLGRDSEARFGQDFELLGYWRFLVDALSRFWRCDQDLCLNLWYDFKKLVWQDELNPRVRCAFGNVFNANYSPCLLLKIGFESQSKLT